jgi:hypothetical protein
MDPRFDGAFANAQYDCDLGHREVDNVMERKGGAVFYVEKAERPVKAVSLGKRMACIRRDASSIGDPGFGDVEPSWASTLGT